jgi:hypothetical protein
MKSLSTLFYFHPYKQLVISTSHQGVMAILVNTARIICNYATQNSMRIALEESFDLLNLQELKSSSQPTRMVVTSGTYRSGHVIST